MASPRPVRWLAPFVVKKRLEDLCGNLRLDPHAVIDHLEQRIPSRRQIPHRPHQGPVERHRRGADDETPPLGHRLARVDRQIEHHLIELCSVGLDHHAVTREIELEDHILSEQRQQGPGELRNHLAELKRIVAADRLAAERQQVLR